MPRADRQVEGVPEVVDLRGVLDEDVVAAARILVWTLGRELPHRRWAIVDRVGHVVVASDDDGGWQTAGALAQVQLDDDDAWLEVVADVQALPADAVETVAARAAARMLLAVVASNRRARQAELAADRAWWVASVDPVARVLNARGWWERIEELAAANPTDVDIACFAITNLVAINERHGYLHGDLVLRVAAERVSAGLGVGDVIARLGGASFVVLAHDAEPEELRKRIATVVAVDGVSVRVGVARQRSGELIRATMARADLDLRTPPERRPPP